MSVAGDLENGGVYDPGLGAALGARRARPATGTRATWRASPPPADGRTRAALVRRPRRRPRDDQRRSGMESRRLGECPPDRAQLDPDRAVGPRARRVRRAQRGRRQPGAAPAGREGCTRRRARVRGLLGPRARALRRSHRGRHPDARSLAGGRRDRDRLRPRPAGTVGRDRRHDHRSGPARGAFVDRRRARQLRRARRSPTRHGGSSASTGTPTGRSSSPSRSSATSSTTPRRGPAAPRGSSTCGAVGGVPRRRLRHVRGVLGLGHAGARLECHSDPRPRVLRAGHHAGPARLRAGPGRTPAGPAARGGGGRADAARPRRGPHHRHQRLDQQPRSRGGHPRERPTTATARPESTPSSCALAE